MYPGPGPDRVKVVFSLPDPGHPVAVVGSFNDWDPHATFMRRRSNGTRSATYEAHEGEVIVFRYLLDGHAWVNDPDADQVPDHLGGTNCEVVARAPLGRRRHRPR